MTDPRYNLTGVSVLPEVYLVGARSGRALGTMLGAIDPVAGRVLPCSAWCTVSS